MRTPSGRNVGASQRARTIAHVDGGVIDAPAGTPVPANGEAPAERGNRRFVRIILGILFVITCIGLRVLWLRYDPPGWLSWSSGVYTDEGYYTLDARHRVLFGTLAPGNFHDSYLSPLLSAIQFGWFKLVGVGLIQARLLDVIFGLATLALFWDLLRRRCPRGIANAAAVMLGLSPVYLFYNCLALQETPALFWIVLGLWLMQVASELTVKTDFRRAGLALYFLAGFAALAAVGCKSIAVIYVIIAWLSDWPQQPDRGIQKSFAIGYLLAMAVGGALLWYPHRDDLARMSAYYASNQIVPHSWMQAWLDIRRALVDPHRGVVLYLCALMPVAVVLSVLGIRKTAATDTSPVLWLATGLLLCAFSNYAPSRYYVLFLPALCWLAGIGWCELSRPRRRYALAAAVIVSLLWIGNAWAHRTSSVIAANAVMQRLASKSTVVAGEFAPELALGSEARTAPVQPGLSNGEDPVGALHPDYVVIRHAPFWDKWWNAQYPGLTSKWPVVAHFDVGPRGSYSIDVYQVTSIKGRVNNAH